MKITATDVDFYSSVTYSVIKCGSLVFCHSVVLQQLVDTILRLQALIFFADWQRDELMEHQPLALLLM